MKRFLLGLLTTLLVTGVIAWLAPRVFVWGYDGRPSPLGLGLTVVTMPLVVAWLVAEIYQAVRPRRIFRGRRRSSLFVVGYGAVTGFAALALGAVMLAYLDTRVGDAPLLAASTGLAVAGALALLGRHRPGDCVYCRYDLRATSVASAGRCVECGQAAS